MTASSRLSCATSFLVRSNRFITLALCAPIAPDEVAVMARSTLEYLAARQKRRKDECDRRLRGDRLLDRAVDAERKLVEARDRDVFDRKRIEHRPHGLAHQHLAEIELAERAAFRDEDESRDLAGHDQRGEHIRDRAEAAGLHENGAAHAAHPRAADDAERF